MFGLDQAGLFPDLSGLFPVETKEEVLAKIKAENPNLSGVELTQAMLSYDMETYGGVRIGDTVVDPNFVGSLVKVGGKAAVQLTLKTLDRIAAEIKQPEVAHQTIEQYLNRPGVGKDERSIISNVLETMKSKAGTAKIKVGEFMDEVRTNLLPLKTKRISDATPDVDLDNMSAADFENLASGNATRYEGINLPPELKVPTKNYSENLYESPIKTSAGKTHFRDSSDSYFAHTRTEDLVGNKKDAAGNIVNSGVKTRRVLEVQSDLFQKDRLKNSVEGGYEASFMERFPEDYSKVSDEQRRMTDLGNANLKKLSPYENTWHERVIREETKKAAQDGQLKMQVPTGETAMKIEGLGETSHWVGAAGTDATIPIKVEDLAIGKEIQNVQPGFDGAMLPESSWVITEVLGDGKFKAVPSFRYTTSIDSGLDADMASYLERIRKEQVNYEEQFDISGNLDKQNPIYQFYESKIDKFVKKEYGAQLVTDAKGVTWWEYDVPKDAGKNPVQALGVGLFGIGELKDDIFGTKTLTSEDDKATYETTIPGPVRSLMGDKMEYKRTEKEQFVPLTEKEEPMFAPSNVTNKIVDAIAWNETRGAEGDKYLFRKFSGDEAMGDDVGKYQITEGELDSYSEKFLGFKVKAGVFQNHPEWQDQYIKNKVAFLENEGLDIHEILALHRYGITGWGDQTKIDAKVLKAAAYIDEAFKFMKETSI